MRSPEQLSARFRAQGLKVTPQRQCIFRVLHGNEGHPTADAVYTAAAAEMPTISLKTVYQTLNDLVAMREIAVLDLGTGAARFDPNVEAQHHHLVCERCGKVRDVHLDVAVPALPDDERRDFSVTTAEVVYRGVCPDCTQPRQPRVHKERHG